MATQIVLDAAREKNLNACVVFPSGILGPEDYAVGEITDTVIKIIEGKTMSFISQGFLIRAGGVAQFTLRFTGVKLIVA